MPKIYGKGHEILACLNIDYESYIQEIVNELMSNPTKRYRLSLEKAPQLKKKKSVKK